MRSNKNIPSNPEIFKKRSAPKSIDKNIGVMVTYLTADAKLVVGEAEISISRLGEFGVELVVKAPKTIKITKKY